MRMLVLGLISFLMATPSGEIPLEQPLIREYSPPGDMDALIVNYSVDTSYLLVQLNLKSDSLVARVMDNLPLAQLNHGPASYQRMMNISTFQQLEETITSPYYQIISDDYNLPNSRSFWVQVHEGSETQGTWTDDEAISYDCDCLSGASECVRLGYYAWYNPLDYWGEAWYAYDPPFYQEIQEVRVTVRGAQCDALPLSSESYLGMRNNQGGWSQDYQLSIDYTDNEFIVPSDIWSDGFLMPQMGSEDNYVIDNVKLEFYYSCDGAEYSPANLLASDASSCTNVDISWELSPSEALGQRLYRDDVLIANLGPGATSYQDWLALPNTTHIYCIETYNECGDSPQICNPGSLHAPPNIAENTLASDGLYENQIVVTWDENEDTDTYKIYRDGTWLGINNSTQTEYIDQFVDFGITYEYCIESINVCGNSGWACDLGFTNIQPGDVNDDGSINVLDVVVMVNVILLLEDATEYIVWAADLNFDGSINIMDVILLVNQILE
jgi:hypothetical protein